MDCPQKTWLGGRRWLHLAQIVGKVQLGEEYVGFHEGSGTPFGIAWRIHKQNDPVDHAQNARFVINVDLSGASESLKVLISIVSYPPVDSQSLSLSHHLIRV